MVSNYTYCCNITEQIGLRHSIEVSPRLVRLLLRELQLRTGGSPLFSISMRFPFLNTIRDPSTSLRAIASTSAFNEKRVRGLRKDKYPLLGLSHLYLYRKFPVKKDRKVCPKMVNEKSKIKKSKVFMNILCNISAAHFSFLRRDLNIRHELLYSWSPFFLRLLNERMKK